MTAPTGIAARLADHYARQIAWVEESNRALDVLIAMPKDSELDQVTAEDGRRAEDLKSLEAEFNALKKEWDATPAFLPDERNAVRTLVMRLRSVSLEFQQKLETLLQKLSAAGNGVQEELGTLRKARDVMQKFVSGPTAGGGFFDRRA